MSIPCDASGVVNENPENMTQRYDAAGVPRMSLLDTAIRLGIMVLTCYS